MILRVIFIFFLCYLGVRFIFGFVIPVVMATIKMRRKMKEMQGFQDPGEADHQNNTSSSSRSATPTPSKSDYIDFEEVK